MKENYDNVNESVEAINKTGCYKKSRNTTQGQQWSCNNNQTIQSESMKEGVEFIIYIQNSLLQKEQQDNTRATITLQRWTN